MIIVGNIYAGLKSTGGTVTGANNGVSLSGTLVQLGGSPLINNRVITLAGHNLTISDADSVSTFRNSIIFFNVTNGGNDYVLSLGILGITLGDNSFAMSIVNGVMTVTNTANAYGFQKDASITAAAQLANQNAYVTTDCLGGASQGIAKLNMSGQTGNQTYLLYTTASKAQLLRVNIAVFRVSKVGTMSIVLNFLDSGGVPQSTTLATIVAAAAATSLSAEVCYPQALGDVFLIISQSLGDTFNVFATVDYLGIQN